jgi:hypothetical protein
MIKCDCCQKRRKTLYKDFRFIEGLFQGKCLMCQECILLNDVGVYKTMTGGAE